MMGWTRVFGVSREDLVGVPFMLSFVPGGRPGEVRPGRGEAGYTVEYVRKEHVADFLRDLPGMAWMPGTRRLGEKYGVRPR